MRNTTLGTRTRCLAPPLLPLVLLLALLPAPAQASVSRAASAWESNPPAAALAAPPDSTLSGLQAALELPTGEPPERFRLFEPEAAALVEPSAGQSFHPLQGVALLDTELRRGPPTSYPETRVWVIEVLGTTFVGEATGLSVELRPACSGSSCGVVSGNEKDPLGLQSFDDVWSASDARRVASGARERARQALRAEREAQEREGNSWWGNFGSALKDKAHEFFSRASAADQRLEDAVGGASRDLGTNLVPPAAGPIDRGHGIPTDLAGQPYRPPTEILSGAQNTNSEVTQTIAEGTGRAGYQMGRDSFILGGTGKLLREARELRAAEAPIKSPSQILRENMKAAGIQPPKFSNAAHHIVAEEATAAAAGREHLARLGIDVNEAANGVFLRNTQKGTGALHSGGHLKAYYEEVNRLVLQANTPEEARAVLKQIGSELADGTFRPW